ncbi:tetratricopeptide repeat protein [Thalassotalea agarivorans]|uniref:Tetratricopeptide repeat-containing protein n=1 Tax=Thalassotalea agarivorans TaxID=349064 RepID=A0A1I0FXZ6_THASX|nr:hypothetical protein [Thalassotalea agarivorans]SET62573.1 hypothetical protein SAMN05660429_02252 [Thalassotalea agarivorans]
MNRTSTLSKSIALVFALCSYTASANSDNLKVAVFSDNPGTKKIVAGNYEKGLEEVSNASESNEIAIATANCVANIKLNQFEQAKSHCDQAVSLSEATGGRSRKDQYVKAVTYSNRAILHYLNNDRVAAIDDLTDAMHIQENDVTKHNLSVIQATVEQDSTLVADD